MSFPRLGRGSRKDSKDAKDPKEAEGADEAVDSSEDDEGGRPRFPSVTPLLSLVPFSPPSSFPP